MTDLTDRLRELHALTFMGPVHPIGIPEALEAAIKEIERLEELMLDQYGLALMMIAEGCENPAQVAADILKKANAIRKGTDD